MADYRILEDRIIEGNKHCIYAAGRSGDTKPAGDFVYGSICMEYDAEAEKLSVYFYDETAGQWKKV